MPYAYSWYLDVTTNKKWNALIINDYDTVFPLPYNQKIVGFHQVYQPILSQQLGLFGTEINDVLVSEFLQSIPSRYRRINTHLNYLNGPSSKERVNLILDLNKPYKEVLASYSSSLRKRLRKLDSYALRISDDVDGLVGLYRNELEEKVQFGESNYEKAAGLFRAVLHHKKGTIYEVICDNTRIAIGMFLNSHNRIINVFGASTSDPKYKGAMAFLLDGVIKQHCEASVLFDFEGSEIPGVRSFFESFGAVQQNYSVYNQSKFPINLIPG